MIVVFKKFTPEGHERYYKVVVSPNLLGEFLLTREYGNTAYSKPTRVLEKPFLLLESALEAAEKIIKKRLKNQYRVVFREPKERNILC